MKYFVCVVFLFFTVSEMGAQDTTSAATFDINAAERFANSALACVHKEYPHKLSHTLNSDADVAPPRKLTPAFYDWHSSVHGHWLLARLVRTLPDASFGLAAREALRQSLGVENIVQEAVYLRAEGRTGFERPYGLAWLLQLLAGLRDGDDPQAREMAAHLRPLDQAALGKMNDRLAQDFPPGAIVKKSQNSLP